MNAASSSPLCAATDLSAFPRSAACCWRSTSYGKSPMLLILSPPTTPRGSTNPSVSLPLVLRRLSLSHPPHYVPGYKEFESYLSARHRDPSRTLENDDELRRMFDVGVENMKTSTRQYAKRQVKWIKSKLLPAVRKLEDQSDVTVVLLDASGAFDRSSPDCAQQLALTNQLV